MGTVAHDLLEKERVGRQGLIGQQGRQLRLELAHPATGQTQPVGVTGEICFRGYHIMRGYYADPETTKQAIDERGWLHSGDLGEMDADGYLRVTGRLKEMIEALENADILITFGDQPHPEIKGIGATVAAAVNHQGR